MQRLDACGAWQLFLPGYGGGEVWFDGKLVRKDGLFIPKPLQQLNPAHLLKA